MLNAVSGVNFRGEVSSSQNIQDLIGAPSRFEAPNTGIPADSFEKAGGEKKKSKVPAIMATIVGLAALAYVGLGIAVGKGKLTKVEGTDLKLMEKAQNWAHAVGDNAHSAWNKVAGWFGKKGTEVASEGQAAGEQAANNVSNAAS